LIALSFTPFVVVHVNVAFTLLSSQPSTKVLGKPLHELMDDPVVVAALQTSCTIFSLRSLHEQTVKVRTPNSEACRSSCRVSVSPIGRDANSTTHYALELESLDTSKNNGDDIVEDSSDIRVDHRSAAAASEHHAVMG